MERRRFRRGFKELSPQQKASIFVKLRIRSIPVSSTAFLRVGTLVASVRFATGSIIIPVKSRTCHDTRNTYNS